MENLAFIYLSYPQILIFILFYFFFLQNEDQKSMKVEFKLDLW